MSQAIGDPDELERFAHALTQFIETMNDAVANLNLSFASLGDTWKDGKRIQFEEIYNVLLHQLSLFEANTSEQIPHIRLLASRLRDYLQS